MKSIGLLPLLLSLDALAMNLPVPGPNGISRFMDQLKHSGALAALNAPGPHSHGRANHVADIVDVAAKGTSLLIDLLSFTSEQGIVDRSLSLEIRNRLHFNLINPQAHLLVGVIAIVPPIQIDANGGMTIVKFEKVSTWWVWKGVSGCLSYEVENEDKTVLVGFNVPFDVNTPNRYNIRITSPKTSASKNICKALLRVNDEVMKAKNSIGRLARAEHNVNYYGRMTTNKRAQLLVTVD